MKSELNQVLNDINFRKRVLTFSEAYDILKRILTTNENYIIPAWTALFSSIQNRGPSTEEIKGFLECVKDYCGVEIDNSKKPMIPNIGNRTISLVGSGKDDIKTINVSTISSVVLASLEKCFVIKQGSYGGSSVCGTRDLLESFGIDVQKAVTLTEKTLKSSHLAFSPIEKYVQDFDRKYRSNFIFFHPLSYVLAGVLNPYYLEYLVMGVTDMSRSALSAELLQKYQYNGVVVSGSIDGYGHIDELSPFGMSKVIYFGRKGLYHKKILPEEIFGKKLNPIKYICQSSDLEIERRKFVEILKGIAPFEAIAYVAMNTGICISLLTLETLQNSVEEALAIIQSGKPYETWEKYEQTLPEN